MLGPFDYAIWIIGALLDISVVVCAIYRGAFLRYICLNLFMLATVAVQFADYVCITRYGVASRQYHFVYYYTDSLSTILMFFMIIQLYQQVFTQMKASRYIRRTATALLAGTALFSYLVVHEHRANLTDHLAIEMGQNLYFVGVVLTYVLWAAIFKLGETRMRLVHFVLALGIYFSGTAGAFALRNLFPSLGPLVLYWIPPIIGVWLPLAWTYTLIRVPEEARFVTARLAAKSP